MPGGNGLQIAPDMANVQFEFYLDKTALQPEVPLAQENYELLYQQPGGGSLGFAPRAASWWARRQNRKQTREELANLINESFGKGFASVERGWLFQDSIGHRLMRDCAPQGLFSVTKIDEKALKKILRRVNTLR